MEDRVGERLGVLGDLGLVDGGLLDGADDLLAEHVHRVDRGAVALGDGDGVLDGRQ